MEGPLFRNLPMITGLLAFVMFIVGGCYALVSLQLIFSGIPAKGTIVDTKRWSSELVSGNEKYKHYPIVRFQTEKGADVEITTSEYFGHAPGYSIDAHLPFAVGDEVEVLYLPGSPREAKFNNFDELWGWSLLLWKIGIGLAMLAAILGMALTRYRKKNNSETLDPWFYIRRSG